MIKNYTPASYETITEYYIAFDDGKFNGSIFPCDEKGNLLSNICKEAIANYKTCLQHPERYLRFNKVIKMKWQAKINAQGTCHCGNKVELYSMYLGGCQCDKCGQWYNLFGQELLPPEQWED